MLVTEIEGLDAVADLLCGRDLFSADLAAAEVLRVGHGGVSGLGLVPICVWQIGVKIAQLNGSSLPLPYIGGRRWVWAHGAL